MGLFDGGFDMESLAQMLNPISGAQAAGMPPLPDTSSIGNVGGLTPDALRSRGMGMDMSEPNPSPVQPGQIPLPRPAPPGAGVMPSPGGPATVPGVMRLDPGAPAQDVGAALTQPAIGPTSVGGAPLGPTPGVGPTGPVQPGNEGGGTSGATDLSARAKNLSEARPSLAQALKGVQAPAAPALQKISSPNAPRPTGAIKGGDLQALLMALNAGVPALAGRQLPITLGGRGG